MGKVLYVPLRLARRVNVSAVVSIYKHLTLYSLNYPRRGCRFLQPGPSGFVLGGSAFSGMPNLKTLRGEAFYCLSNILRSACCAQTPEPDYQCGSRAGFRVVLAPPVTEA